MVTATQRGYLVLADISGYTAYLAGVELEHAQDVLRDLLESIVERFRPVLTVAKLEGDAVFAYAPDAKVRRGETLLELLESTYVAFKDRVAACARRTTCQCAACRAIPTLDLKFIAHNGAYVAQRVAGGSELVGSDVNLVHRLLKNHVGEATGWRAYALLTEVCLARLGVPSEGMHEQTETYEPFGEIKTYSVNLQTRYQELTEARRVIVTPEEADAVLVDEIAAPPAVVWTWLNDPQKRGLYVAGTKWTAETRPGGRTGRGARNHCAHGKDFKGSAVETVVDWRPFEYFTVEQVSGPMTIVQTNQLLPTPDGSGTRLQTYTKLQTKVPRFMAQLMCRYMVGKMYKPARATMTRLIAEEMAATAGADTAAAPLPA